MIFAAHLFAFLIKVRPFSTSIIYKYSLPSLDKYVMEEMQNEEIDLGGNESFSRNMTIIDGLCWKCAERMKVAVSEGDDGISQYCGPDEFTNEELSFAREQGVLIEVQESKTAEISYLANTCPHCRTFVGDFYLFTQYIQPADLGEYQSAVYEITSHQE